VVVVVVVLTSQAAGGVMFDAAVDAGVREKCLGRIVFSMGVMMSSGGNCTASCHYCTASCTSSYANSNKRHQWHD
jgi:biotin synthase-like enzyme